MRKKKLPANTNKNPEQIILGAQCKARAENGIPILRAAPLKLLTKCQEIVEVCVG
jgi:hypothetical protein